MSDRTYGETRNCAGCRYWSEMVAQCFGGGHVTAMCLAPAPAEFRGKYTPPSVKCNAWVSGHFGAVDEPGQDPNVYAGEPQ
ncbi:MAG: hypothetical protein ACE15D_18945 [Candidatus Eisenbacteria bacterium]